MTYDPERENDCQHCHLPWRNRQLLVVPPHGLICDLCRGYLEKAIDARTWKSEIAKRESMVLGSRV